MNAIIVIVIIITLLQLICCHFSLWWIISLIARVLFSLRIIGATFKVKTLVIIEGVSFACMVLFNMLFHKGAVPWGRIGLYLVFTLASAAAMYLDDLLYVYVIDDDEED